MTDPFAPPQIGAPAPEPAPLRHPLADPQLAVLCALLVAASLGLIGVGVVVLAIGVALFATGDPEGAAMLPIAAAEALFFAACAVPFAASAACVAIPRRGALVLAAVGTGLLVPTCCLPVGVWGLYALLRPQALAAYGFSEPG